MTETDDPLHLDRQLCFAVYATAHAFTAAYTPGMAQAKSQGCAPNRLINHRDISGSFSQPEMRSEADPFLSTCQGSARCLVAERCWDQVRWAIEEHAWRFERRAKAARPRRS